MTEPDQELLDQYEREMAAMPGEIDDLVEDRAWGHADRGRLDHHVLSDDLDQYGEPYMEPAEGSSWTLRSLADELNAPPVEIRPAVLIRTDGRGLLHEGRTNGIHGGPGEGKTIVSTAAVAQRLKSGGVAAFIDHENSHPALLIEQLRLMAVADELIAERLLYVSPDGMPGRSEIDSAVDAASDLGPHALVVIDSVGESMGSMGLDENKDLDVDTWAVFLPRRFERAGHTPLLIDHSTKANDHPLYPSGSKRKLALTSGAAWRLECVVPFSREHPGKVRLTCAKDRLGVYRRGEIGAWVHVDPTGRDFVTIEAPSTTDAAPVDAEIVLIRRVIEAVKAAGIDGVGRNALRAQVRHRAKASNQAIDDATELASQIGAISVTGTGTRGSAITHRFVRDLAEDDLRRLGS
jgi:RecA/RadA recombinase